MASDASFVQFVVDQVTGAGAITTRFMFGDYALYCNEKVVALICDNKLFVKPTGAGRAYIGTPVEAPAYTGAKPSFLIEDKLEDRTWLTELIRITEKEVATPAKKKPKKSEAIAGKPDAPAAAAKPATTVVKKAAKKPAPAAVTKAAKKFRKKTPKKAVKPAAKKTLKKKTSRR